MKPIEMTVAALAEALQSKEVSSQEVTRAYLDNLAREEADIGAYITVTEEAAMQQAKRIDEARANGEDLSKLAGVPAGIKDNICTKGTLTTCASKMLSNFVPPYQATVMEHLQDTVLLGKMNMDEFAMGSTTENSWYHVTHNPRNLACVPGGSSGGSAAAVAARLAPFTLGSDTGGSIRQPAAFCGVVGMKPTYGSVSRYGLIAFASSLDQIGPLTKNVYDSALVLNEIVGYDRRDSTSVKRQYADFTRHIGREIKGKRIALPQEYFGEGLAPEVKEAVLAAAKKLEALGAQIVELSMPSLKAALPAYYVISSSEASSNLARFDGVKYGFRAQQYDSVEDLYRNTRSEGFGAEVKRRIMLGTFALSSGYYDAYYKKALQVRTIIVQEFQQMFEQCDVVLAPVAPTTAYRIGEKRENPLEMYLGDVYTVPVNIAGLPALSMPCGTDAAGLPIGMQLIGNAFGETELYQIAYALEAALQEGGSGK
ncbi:MAG: Asp-tRNA(Asn)/Glu-tRNA(Gln) amidotransferase subunit GatA [Clostridia bacterium]|nr:Asp-tRNA(Asn)/Glu-tRNA(Gln) amidotransferase subunit GatA [Clostridia bacterium]